MRRLFVAGSCLVVLLAGCGGDSDVAASTTTDIGSTTAAPTTAAPTTAAPTTTSAPSMSTSTTMMHDDEDDYLGDFEEYIPTAEGPVTSEYTVLMTEFAFEPELSLTPGETVRFTLINDGVIPHEFRLTTAHKAEEHIAAGHDHSVDDDGHHDESPDIVVYLEAGETRVVELTLPSDPDAFDQVACLIPGHYEAGMWSGLVFGAAE